MEGEGPSRTAIGAAVGRHMHLLDPGPRIFEDPLALDLAGEAGLENLAEMQQRKVHNQRLYALSFVIRARYVEDMVEQAVRDGVGQYVILGAGLDSFAYRRRELLDRLCVFEVDHPQTQAWKKARLAELGVEVPSGLVYAPVDFETETLSDGLEASGFDRAAPVCCHGWR